MSEATATRPGAVAGGTPGTLLAALDRTRALLDDAAGALARTAAEAGADAVQIPLYDLAFAHAEITAARALAQRLEAVGSDDPVQRGLAAVAAGEALGSVRGRLAQRPGEFGLDEAAVLAATYPEGFPEALGSRQLSALGAALTERDGELGADHLGPDHGLVRDTFREFADRRVAPLAERIHRKDEDVPDEIVEGLRELGCFGLSVPQRFGGLLPDDREDTLGMIVVTEELSRASLGAAGSLITRPEIMARALLEGGTAEQQAHWLPRLAAGRPLCAVSVTEPNTGSDVASVALRATPVEGGWRLNGTKTWCTYAGRAEVLLVLARTEPDPALGHRGLSLFLVEKPDTPGHAFEVRPAGGGLLSGRAIPTLGYRGMHSFEMFYDDVFVPDTHLIGGEAGRGRGFYFTMRGFAGGRIQTAARACGLMRAAYEAGLRYAGERRVFGKPIGAYPLSRAKLARMAAQILAGQQCTYQVARLLDEGAGQMEASLVKLYTCKAAEWVTREALQLHGGMGYAEETAVSRYWVDARVLSIFEGAEETLALKVVGRALLAGL